MCYQRSVSCLMPFFKVFILTEFEFFIVVFFSSRALFSFLLACYSSYASNVFFTTRLFFFSPHASVPWVLFLSLVCLSSWVCFFPRLSSPFPRICYSSHTPIFYHASFPCLTYLFRGISLHSSVFSLPECLVFPSTFSSLDLIFCSIFSSSSYVLIFWSLESSFYFSSLAECCFEAYLFLFIFLILVFFLVSD